MISGEKGLGSSEQRVLTREWVCDKMDVFVSQPTKQQGSLTVLRRVPAFLPSKEGEQALYGRLRAGGILEEPAILLHAGDVLRAAGRVVGRDLGCPRDRPRL
jgi:hypothetical protein